MSKATTVYVEFRIMGDQFDIESITQALSISPTETWEKGSTAYHAQGKIKIIRKYTNWTYGTREEESLDTNIHITEIENVFKSKLNTLKQLKETYNLSFSVDIVISIRNEQPPGLCLKGFILELATALDARIDIDILMK